MTDAHEEGGDPACWLHLFEDEPEEADPRSDRPPAAAEGDGPAPEASTGG